MKRVALVRKSRMKKSYGTTWPPDVARAIEARDQSCIGPRIGMPGDCLGVPQKDHVRASHGIGMKSRSTADNGVLLCVSHHDRKTLEGVKWRILQLAYLSRYYPDAAP